MNPKSGKSLYNRYINGEISEVWQEIVSFDLDNRTPSEADFVDIDRVFDEMMSRVNRNITVVINALNQLDYKFMDLGDNGLQEKSISSKYPVRSMPLEFHSKNFFSVEKLVFDCGYIPLSFKKFLEKVGSVNLVGIFPHLEGGEVPLLDPLQVFPENEMFKYHQYLIDDLGELPQDEEGFKYLIFSYDEETKEGASGSGFGYGIRIYPNFHLDGAVVNYGISISFIDYLRLCFKWCGLPSLEWLSSDVDRDLSESIKSFSASLLPF